MGYWSILTSVDYLDDDCNYELLLPPGEALAEIERVLPREGRVTASRTDPNTVVATTIKHTPAWAWAVPLGPLFLRTDCRADITVSGDGNRSVARVRGKLDTRAASRIRDLRPG